MTKPHSYVTHTIHICEGNSANWQIQFEEHDKVYNINGKVMELIIKLVDKFEGATGKAIDALHVASEEYIKNERK